MKLYAINITKRNAPDAAAPDTTYVVADSRTAAVTAFEAALTPQERNRIDNLSLVKVSEAVLMAS